MEFHYTASTSQYHQHPMRLYLADLHVKDQEKPIRMINNLDCDWGEASPVEELFADALPIPELLVQRWWSPREMLFYNAVVRIDSKKAEQLWQEQMNGLPLNRFTHIVTGMAPYGGTAIWLCGYNKSVLLQYHQAEVVKVTPQIFEKLCKDNAHARMGAELPPREQFASWMRQYNYRYVPLEEFWDEKKNVWIQYPDDDTYYDDQDILSVEDCRTDGSFDYTGDYAMMIPHAAGRPRRFCVRWKQGNTDYESHFWLDDQKAAPLFDHLANHHPTATIDIIIRIDPRAHHYELALSCEGVPQPLPIPSTVYQQLIFRDNYEYYKSENYDQEDGAWRW